MGLLHLIPNIDAWFYKLNKEYGRNGLFEVTFVGKRQIVITHAEYIENLLRHVIRSANYGLLDLLDLDTKNLAFNHYYNPNKIENGLFEEMSNYWIDLKQKSEDVIIIDIAAWTLITKEMIESDEFIEYINVFFSENQFAYAPKFITGLPFIKNRVKRLLDSNHSLYKRLEETVRRKGKEIEKSINNNDYEFKSKQLDLLPSLIITMDTFCFVLYYISHNPNVKKKLLEEIKSVFKQTSN
ncbi:2440_t:CDS:2, partial [Diversispora eburnea]